MDANLAAAIITALVALVAVLGTAIFVAIRRNGNGTPKGAQAEDIVKQMLSALTGRDDILREMLVNQEGMAGLFRQTNETLREVRNSQGDIAKTGTAMAGLLQVMSGTVKGLEVGQRDLVDIHKRMEDAARIRRELGKMVDEGAHS